MIGSKVPVPVDNDEGSYSVRTKSVGPNQLEDSVTRAIYHQAGLLEEILCELKLMNTRLEAAFETSVNRDDIEDC